MKRDIGSGEDEEQGTNSSTHGRVGRLTGIWAPNYDMVSLGYDAGGRLTEKRIGNGVDSQYTYNPDNTLASLTNKHGTAVISNHQYTYDPLGNRTTKSIGVTISFSSRLGHRCR